METRISEEDYKEYLRHLLAGKRRECAEIIDKLLKAGIDIRDMYMNLFQRTMYRVGLLWERNRITVSVEHQATSITFFLLNMVYPYMFAQEKNGLKAIISCVAEEYHQLGSQIVSDIFELHGWDSYYLGSNTPKDDLLRFIDEKQPDVVGLSLAIYFNMKHMHDTIKLIRKSFPDLPIIIGGQAFEWGGREITSEYNDITYAKGIPELENYIDSERFAYGA